MSYSKQELIEAVIEFKNEYGRYPTRKDFKAKKITPSKNTFYRVFGSMENAIKQAELYEKGELIPEDEREIKSIKAVSKKGGFQCAFCGNYTNGADEYYSSMAKILAMRFIKLLKSSKGQNYFDGVMDCIYYAVFGGKNPVMRGALRSAEYLEIFEQRYDVEAQDLSQQGGGRIKCHRCGKLRENWKITIETISPFRTEYICEDCLINSKKRKMENTKKKNE